MEDSYHEPVEELSEECRDLHRGFLTIMEEFEAADWYQQRIDATKDNQLKEVLTYLRNEELEHATYVMEWLRRNVPELDQKMRAILFREGDILLNKDAPQVQPQAVQQTESLLKRLHKNQTD